jgi:hypothetical protein
MGHLPARAPRIAVVSSRGFRVTPYENEPARAPTTSRPTPGHMPLVPTGSSPCFSRSESGFNRIRENHLTGLWSTGRRGRRVRVRVCWHPNRNDNCPRPPYPVSTWIFTLHRVTKARRPQSIREPKPTMRAVIPGRTTFPHPYSASILGGGHVDATAGSHYGASTMRRDCQGRRRPHETV